MRTVCDYKGSLYNVDKTVDLSVIIRAVSHSELGQCFIKTRLSNIQTPLSDNIINVDIFIFLEIRTFTSYVDWESDIQSRLLRFRVLYV